MGIEKTPICGLLLKIVILYSYRVGWGSRLANDLKCLSRLSIVSINYSITPMLVATNLGQMAMLVPTNQAK